MKGDKIVSSENKKIKDLPPHSFIHDDDIFVESNTLETYKVTADDIAKYVSSNKNLTDKFVTQSSIGSTNGIVPLNSDEKIDGKYITYGDLDNTAYEGSAGKNLEEKLNNEVERAKNAENGLTAHITNGISNITSELSTEKITRENADTTLTNNLNAEIARAQDAEEQNAEAINAETSRATLKENEMISELNLKAPLVSPTFTGIPNVPTASGETNSTQIASTAFVYGSVLAHNSSVSAHTDIRDLIDDLADRLNALADSDDTTLDQLSEIVSYIKSNRTLIESITTDKVNVADIVDNLTSTAINKSLSANQGKVIKELIDTLKTSFESHKNNDTSGNKHIPSGGSSGQILRWSADGTAVWGDDNDTDTKNTAGSTNNNSKLFLVGVTSQADNSQTYSRDTAFVGTDGCLYSNNTRVVSEIVSSSEPTSQKDGDYWLMDY